MAVMTCPHCEEGIDSLTRTGDKKYSCGSCNMVIKYDSIQPHLDEFEVNDKRGAGGSGNDNSNNTRGPGGSGQNTQGEGGEQQMPNHSSSQTEREKIYQRGTDGLKQIKKERLKNWLSSAEGAGAQTEQRISMMFDRNESIHKNPNVLYNLLDDELSASPSFINTMVQDIFQPEQEHEDLLQSQGYQPWHVRGGQNPGARQNRGRGGPMNATGSANYNPNQSSQQQQGYEQNQQQNQQQQNQGNQGNQGSPGDNTLTRKEAEMMMNQAVDQANQQGQRNALMSGLSDATDEALQEMAKNVGGLAGTVQRVIDEALVEYARQNPEWVIENMDILQKVMGATEKASEANEESQTRQSQEDEKVDNALEGIMGDNGGTDNPSRNTQQEASTPEPEPTPSPEVNESSDNTPVEPEVEGEPNPDLDEEHLEDSGFEPEYDTQNFKPNTAGPTQESEQEEILPDEEDVAEEPEVTDESEEMDMDAEEPEESGGSGFDEIFGDIAE